MFRNKFSNDNIILLSIVEQNHNIKTAIWTVLLMVDND